MVVVFGIVQCMQRLDMDSEDFVFLTEVLLNFMIQRTNTECMYEELTSFCYDEVVDSVKLWCITLHEWIGASMTEGE